MANFRNSVPSRAILLAALCGSTQAFADTWDNGSGNAQWSTATNWADNTEPTINDGVIFPGTIPLNQATITMTTTEFAASLSFNNDYTLQAGQMFLGAGGVSVASGRTATINTVINGSSGLSKTGFGTLRLLPTSSNSFSGPINVTGANIINGTSTLYVRSNVALGNTANDINLDSGRLQLDGVTNPLFLMTGRTITAGPGGGAIELQNNAILDLNTALGANANAFSFSGLGTVELNSSSARTGPTFVSAVLLRLNSATALGSPGSAALSNGAVLELNDGSGNFAGTVNFGAGTTLRSGVGAHTYSGIANIGGNMTMSGGLTSSDTLILNGDVLRQGAGFTTTVGSGAMRLDSANSYAGSWAIGGQLELRHPDALGTGTTPIVVSSSGRLSINTPTLSRDITLNNPGGGIELLQDATVSGQVSVVASPGFVPIVGPGREFTLAGPTSTFTSTGIAFFGGGSGVRSMRVIGGASVSGTSTRLSGQLGEPCRLTVSGAGSTYMNSVDVWVGYSTGTGSLLVEAGGLLSCPQVYIGLGDGGSGTVTDSGSLLTSSDVLVVGFNNVSTLSVLNGGEVFAARANVGELPGASGTVSVSGPGSTLSTQGLLEVGKSGAGVLNINNGGGVSCLGLALGDGSTSSGSCTITGGIATLECGAEGVTLSRNGATSTLNLQGGSVDVHGNITDGGEGLSTLVLDAATLDMHNFAFGGVSPIDTLQFRSGTLKNVSGINNGAGLAKTGPGVLYLNTPNTYGGPTTVGTGTLFVVNSSGSATGSGVLTVSSGATLAGPGLVGGAVTNHGFVSPEGFNGIPFGTLTLLDSYSQSQSGTLMIEIGSASELDVLAVTGAASLAGTLGVTLLNGYQPSAGDTFTVLNASSITGTFDTTNLPALAGGLAWQVAYLTGHVQLQVGPACSADIDSDGDYSNGLTPDGGIDINDLLAFLGAFQAGDSGADLDDDGINPPTPNGGVDINDLLFFLARFEAGC